jgi:predicted TIM-barrel fold metal-dependent hydrolase
VKLYTAEWHGDSRGYKLNDPWAYRYFEACQELGITNIHIHKGPTIRPLDRDAFDVADVDKAATDFTDLNFVVEPCGSAAAGGRLLDRNSGTERARRPRGRDPVHPHPPPVLRPDHG